VRGVEEQALGKKRPSRARIDSPAGDESRPMDVDAKEEEEVNEEMIVVQGDSDVLISTTGPCSHPDTNVPLPRSEEERLCPALVDGTSDQSRSKADQNSKSNRDEPKYNDPLVHTIFNENLRCQHGNLDPYKTEEIRYISKVGSGLTMKSRYTCTDKLDLWTARLRPDASLGSRYGLRIRQDGHLQRLRLVGGRTYAQVSWTIDKS